MSNGQSGHCMNRAQSLHAQVLQPTLQVNCHTFTVPNPRLSNEIHQTYINIFIYMKQFAERN